MTTYSTQGDYDGLLDALVDHDGSVHVETLKTLGAARGYVPATRLNGIAGGRAPSIASDGDYRILTPAGWSRARR